jgi:hypothetical protein
MCENSDGGSRDTFIVLGRRRVVLRRTERLPGHVVRSGFLGGAGAK